jgi:hypothetical protein
VAFNGSNGAHSSEKVRPVGDTRDKEKKARDEWSLALAEVAIRNVAIEKPGLLFIVGCFFRRPTMIKVAQVVITVIAVMMIDLYTRNCLLPVFG